MRFSLFPFTILICSAGLTGFCAALAGPAGASEISEALTDNRPLVHPHTDKCIACHTDDFNIEKMLAAADNECLQCHDVNKIRSSVRKMIERGATDQTAGETTQVTVPDETLAVPMYSATSRFGAEPGEMILIPAGAFIMGTDQRLPDEGPRHTVNLEAYYIDKYEVTNLQYEKFNNATGRRSPAHFRNRTYPEGKGDHPVTHVTWDDADAYCRWAGKRLPTDQEWEKAARGTDGRMFPWGDDFKVDNANTPVRWKKLGLFGDTTPVGAFPAGASPFGLMDMSGNVWEWTASWYKAYPGNTIASESYGERYKTLKGGSWFDCSFYKCGISAPVYNRAFFATRTRNDSFGFRCAKDAPSDEN
jgi:serine/threonine-protein kinase